MKALCFGQRKPCAQGLPKKRACEVLIASQSREPPQLIERLAVKAIVSDIRLKTDSQIRRALRKP
jgi:hypothetical protein